MKLNYRIVSLLLTLTTIISHDCYSQTYTGTIISVTDGDTYIFQTEHGSLKIRSEGIDAPETVQPYGKEATAFMEQYLNKEALVIANGLDRYGRTIGTLIIDEEDINLSMLQSGLAWFYKAYSDNIEYQEADSTARALNQGLWAEDAPVPPWQWRNKREKFPGPELSETQVIICTSKSSYTYHKYYCQGLKRCKSEMKVVNLKEAKGAGRKECGWCY